MELNEIDGMERHRSILRHRVPTITSPPHRQIRHDQDATVAFPYKDVWNTHRCPNLVADYGMGIVRKRTESNEQA